MFNSIESRITVLLSIDKRKDGITFTALHLTAFLVLIIILFVMNTLK